MKKTVNCSYWRTRRHTTFCRTCFTLFLSCVFKSQKLTRQKKEDSWIWKSLQNKTVQITVYLACGCACSHQSVAFYTWQSDVCAHSEVVPMYYDMGDISWERTLSGATGNTLRRPLSIFLTSAYIHLCHHCVTLQASATRAWTSDHKDTSRDELICSLQRQSFLSISCS